MAQFNDPRQPNWGVPSRGQLAPNMTASNAQSNSFTQPQQQSPMLASLQRAPSMPARGVPRTGLPKNAVGTFGPNASAYAGIKNRGTTDFGKGGHQGPANAIGSMLNVKSPFGAALGIQRRAKGSGNDYSVQNAGDVLQRGYQSTLGRQASPEEIQSQLAGQGLKPGDNWVGKQGLDAILASLGQSPEALGQKTGVAGFEQNPIAGRANTHDFIPGAMNERSASPQFDLETARTALNTPMDFGAQQAPVFDNVPSALGSALQPKQNAGAQSAYQEYLSEFAPDDPEQPLDYDTFSQYFDQLGGEQQSPMSSAVSGAGWEGLNLGMIEGQGSGMGMNGFNMERALAGGDSKSVKDAFARAMSTFPVDVRGKSKEEVGAVLASPEYHAHLAKQGIQSRPIPGSYDQIEVKTAEEGWTVKDVVSNAGSPEAMWWWGDVGGMSADPNNPMGLMDGYDYGQDEDPELEGMSGDQSSLLAGLTGGGNWKSLLDQLLSQYKTG